MNMSNGKGLASNFMTVVGVLWEGNPAPRSARGRTALHVFLWSLFCLHFTPAYRAVLATANYKSLRAPGLHHLEDVTVHWKSKCTNVANLQMSNYLSHCK